MSWTMIVGVVLTLVVVAIIVQLFLTWSTRRGWFRHTSPGSPQDTRHEADADSSGQPVLAGSTQVSPESGRRLAVYGTLGPGRTNHHQVSGLSGRWIDGTVRGQLRDEGWGAELGYPGLILDDEGSTVDVQLFESSDLPDHWTRLDDFEGSGYRRTVTTVSTADGDLLASIYVLALT